MAENDNRPNKTIPTGDGGKSSNKHTTPHPSLRDTFGTTLIELGEKHENMVFLDADLHTSTKAILFKKRFPDRFYQVGIAEQNLFGIAAGLALEGFMPFPSTFAAFTARRALDQITISIAYPRLNVKIPSSYAGVPTSRAGASHNSIEDIAVMRSIPHMRIAAPASPRDLRAVMLRSALTEGPVYFRIARYNPPEIFPPTHTFEWGRGHRPIEGNDVSLFGTGIMTSFCLEAAELLRKEAIHADVIHLASIKPLDNILVKDSLSKTGCAVTVENAGIYGGFGAAVNRTAASECPVYMERIGVVDSFVESGGTNELFTIHGMTPHDIAQKAKTVIRKKEDFLK